MAIFTKQFAIQAGLKIVQGFKTQIYREIVENVQICVPDNLLENEISGNLWEKHQHSRSKGLITWKEPYPFDCMKCIKKLFLPVTVSITFTSMYTFPAQNTRLL